MIDQNTPASKQQSILKILQRLFRDTLLEKLDVVSQDLLLDLRQMCETFTLEKGQILHTEEGMYMVLAGELEIAADQKELMSGEAKFEERESLDYEEALVITQQPSRKLNTEEQLNEIAYLTKLTAPNLQMRLRNDSHLLTHLLKITEEAELQMFKELAAE